MDWEKLNGGWWPAGYLAGLRRRACVDATLIRLSMEQQLPEWLRAPPQRSSMALLQFLPSSSVTSRIEQFEHLTSSAGSRESSSRAMLGGEMSSVSVTRPFSVPVPCTLCSESRQGIHFDDTSSESESPSKAFLLLLLLLFVLAVAKLISKGIPSLDPFGFHSTSIAVNLWHQHSTFKPNIFKKLLLTNQKCSRSS